MRKILEGGTRPRGLSQMTVRLPTSKAITTILRPNQAYLDPGRLTGSYQNPFCRKQWARACHLTERCCRCLN